MSSPWPALALLPLLLAGCASPDARLEGVYQPAFLPDGSLLVQRADAELELRAAGALGDEPSAPTRTLPAPGGSVEAYALRPAQLRVTTRAGFAAYRWPGGELILRQDEGYGLGLDADPALEVTLRSSDDNLLELVDLRTHFLRRALPRPRDAEPSQLARSLREAGYRLIGGRESVLGRLVSFFSPTSRPPPVEVARFLPSGRIAFCLAGQLFVAELPQGEGPIRLSACPLPTAAAWLELRGERVYVAAPSALAAYELAEIDTLAEDAPTPLWSLETQHGPWQGLTLDPSGERLCLRGERGLSVYAAADGELLHTTSPELGRVRALALARDHVALQGEADELSVWRLGAPAPRLRVPLAPDVYEPPFALAPDGSWLALQAEGGVELWRVP